MVRMSKLINLIQKINCLFEKCYWKKKKRKHTKKQQSTLSQGNEELGVLRDKRQNLTNKRNYALLEDKPST